MVINNKTINTFIKHTLIKDYFGEFVSIPCSCIKLLALISIAFILP